MAAALGRAGYAVVPVARTGSPPNGDVLVHFGAALPGQIPEAEAAALNRALDAERFDEALRRRLPVVYASTAHPGDGPYRAAKLASAADGLRLFADAGVPFTSLRISAPYGPGQVARTVLRIFLERARADQPLTYHGTGSREQDFIHATDVASSVLAALRCPTHGAFPVASGQPVTMRALAELIVRVTGSESPIASSGQPDPQEGQQVRVDVSPTRDAIRWRPTVSLAEGLTAI